MSRNSNDFREPADYSDATIARDKVICVTNSVTGDKKQQQGDERQPAAAVVDEARAQQLAKTHHRRQCYRVTVIVLLVIIFVTLAGSIATTVVVFHDCNTFHKPDSDSSGLDVLATCLLYIMVIIEMVFSAVMAITLAVYACRCPQKVLLIAPYGRGRFVCLCISVFLMALFAVYTFAVPIIGRTTKLNPTEPAAFCVIPAFRVLAYLIIFSVLIANRMQR